jgi:hypothetical protein
MQPAEAATAARLRYVSDRARSGGSSPVGDGLRMEERALLRFLERSLLHPRSA